MCAERELSGPHRTLANSDAAAYPWAVLKKLIVLGFAGGIFLGLPAVATALDLKVLEDADQNVTTISLTGRVEANDGLKLRGFVANLAASKPLVAHLAFAGGLRAEAMSIGRFFHQTRIRTFVPGKGARCVSPCPLVLVGGRDPVSGKPAYQKYSNGGLGFSSVTLSYQDKEYTAKDLDAAVANTQREILQIAEYLQAVRANLDMLRYYQSVLKDNETKFITNEEALDLGISIYVEETGQVIEPLSVRRN